MKCPKCGGLMQKGVFYGKVGEEICSLVQFHCIFCSKILDPVVILNQEVMEKFKENPEKWERGINSLMGYPEILYVGNNYNKHAKYS